MKKRLLALLLTLCMVGMMYALVSLCQQFFLLDFRFIWPFFKGFTLARFGQFLVYGPFFALFFLLNNSKIFAGMRTEATYRPGFKGFLACWWRSALLMIGGVLDLEKDAKKGRYNPLLAMHGGKPRPQADFEPMLLMLAGQCYQAFDRLPLVQDSAILENILRDGIWTRYHESRSAQEHKEKKKEGTPE